VVGLRNSSRSEVDGARERRNQKTVMRRRENLLAKNLRSGKQLSGMVLQGGAGPRRLAGWMVPSEATLFEGEFPLPRGPG